MVVEEFIAVNGSANELAAKYKLGSHTVLLKWVSLYNANRELKDYCPNREVYMAEARRKTTIEERKEIVEYWPLISTILKSTISILFSRIISKIFFTLLLIKYPPTLYLYFL